MLFLAPDVLTESTWCIWIWWWLSNHVSTIFALHLESLQHRWDIQGHSTSDARISPESFRIGPFQHHETHFVSGFYSEKNILTSMVNIEIIGYARLWEGSDWNLLQYTFASYEVHRLLIAFLISVEQYRWWRWYRSGSIEVSGRSDV